LIRSVAATLMCLLTVANCEQEISGTQSSTGINEADIRLIANDLAVEKGMNLLCEANGEDNLSTFMEELRHSGISKEVRESIAADSVVMMNKISTEEPEYICTPEMFEGSAIRVAEARKKWDEMRGITQ